MANKTNPNPEPRSSRPRSPKPAPETFEILIGMNYYPRGDRKKPRVRAEIGQRRSNLDPADIPSLLAAGDIRRVTAEKE